MHKIKILVVVPFLKGTGGTETVLENLQKAYEQSSNRELYDLKLISFGGTQVNRWYKRWKRKVFIFPQNRSLQNLMYAVVVPFLMLRQIIFEKPDIVISTNPILWTYCFLIKKILRRSFKVIGWYHYSVTQKPINKVALKSVDSIFAISSGIRKQLIAIGVSPNKIKVLFNPVVLDNSISKIPFSTKKTEFLYIGRIDYDGQKNVSELFQALKFVHGNWKLRLFGTCSEKDKQKLENLAKQYGYLNRIVFEGFKEDVWSCVSSASVLIMTSKYEGFPMILCEAISRGVFVISSNCETGPEDIVSEYNGLIYKQGDIRQLSEYLEMITETSLNIPSQDIIQGTMSSLNLSSFIMNFEKYCDVN